MSEYKVGISVDVDINDIQSQINGAKVDPIKVKLDVENAEKEINDLKKSLKDMKFSNSSIDKITKDLEKMDVSVSKITSTFKKNGNLELSVRGLDKFNNAINLVREYTSKGELNSKSISKSFKTEVDEINEAFNILKKTQKEINSLEFKLTGLDATKNASEIRELEAQIKNLKTSFNDLYSGFGTKFSSSQIEELIQSTQNAQNHIERLNAEIADTSAMQKMQNELRELKDLARQMGNLEIKIKGLDSNTNANEIAELENQLRQLEQTYNKLISSFNLNSSKLKIGDLRNLDAEFEKTKNELNQLEAKFADTRAELAKKIEIKLESGKFSTQVQKVHSDSKKLSNITNELQTKLDALSTAEKAMNTAFKSGGIEERITAYKNYERILESVENQLKQNKIAEQDSLNAVALKQAQDKLSFDIDNWLKDNSAAAKDFGARIRKLQSQIKDCDATSLSQLKAEFTNIKKEAQLAGKTTQTFSDRLKDQFSKYSSYLSIASVFMYAEQAMRDMFNQVVAIDSAMTELKKVTDESASSYDKFLTNAASKSKEIGTTIDGLVASTADFARLGYGFGDAQGLAEVANIYAVVGDEVEGVEGATESLISTMAAFKDEANGLSNTDFAMGIIDRFNEIGNKFAISSGGVGEALKRSASSLDAANNSIDESIALITAANTVVQDPDRVGRLLPTIKMAISVKIQRWTRPRKDFISIFDIR